MYQSAESSSSATSLSGVGIAVGNTPRSRATDNAPLLQQSQKLYRSLSGVGNNDRSPQSHGDNFMGEGMGSGRSLSTFSGVFCPVVLSMFSVLLFLRVGFVVGQAGVLLTIGLLVLSYVILIFTLLSICAISTNGAIEGGGCYYMISRALGPELGGSIGTLFFLANVFSSALYISGCVEGIVDNFGVHGSFGSGTLPEGRWWSFLYGAALATLCLLICLVGAAWFARMSVLILCIVLVCLTTVILSMFINQHTIRVSIPRSNVLVYHNNNSWPPEYGNYTGMTKATFKENLYPNYAMDYTDPKVQADPDSASSMTFATVFAVLFSGVTGIMAGANMSGDLKQPSISIPRGTLLACLFTFTIYTILIFMVGLSCTNFLLKNNYNMLQQINVWGPFIIIGIITTTFSAALNGLIGASRVLQALAKDEIFGIILRPATKVTNGGNPYISVLLTWLLVMCVLLMGSLNDIAQISSVFFLLSYAACNLACLALELASAPNFRPTFKYFTWHTCLLGVVGNVVMMFLVSAIYASISLMVCLLLITGLTYWHPPATWGSISQALLFHQVRKYLLLLDTRKDHVKFWRPQMLLLVANPRSSCELINFINDLKKSGVYVIGHVKVNKNDEPGVAEDLIQQEYPYWLGLVDYLNVKAFIDITSSRSVGEGAQQLIRLCGLGALKPNTIVLGFYDSHPQQDSFNKEYVFSRKARGVIERGEVMKKFPQLRDDDGDKHLSPEEYVRIIVDAVHLQKNVCLARHFHLLDKSSLMSSSRELYVDVWPLNLLQPQLGLSDVYDTASLYCLQLACILNMTQDWKRHTVLRVFLPIEPDKEDVAAREARLDDLLQQLRISAQIQLISWDTVLAANYNSDPESDAHQKKGDEFHRWNMNDDYVESVNNLLKQQVSNTAVVFFTLPLPPKNPKLHPKYLHLLDKLSVGLPPCVMVHGISIVTSTTL